LPHKASLSFVTTYHSWIFTVQKSTDKDTFSLQ